MNVQPVKLPPTEAEVRAQSLLRRIHLQGANAPISQADESGAFPGVLLPKVFPVVLDANMLRGELLRTVRSGRTILSAQRTAAPCDRSLPSTSWMKCRNTTLSGPSMRGSTQRTFGRHGRRRFCRCFAGCSYPRDGHRQRKPVA